MADEVVQPEGTLLVTPEDIANAEGAEGLHLPTNAELLENEEAKDKEGNTDGGQVPGGTPDPAAPKAQAEEVVYEEVADPGEFTPGDYSFELTVFDAEGKNPKVVKITSLDQFDTLLESDPNLGNSAAVARAFRAQTKMERGLEDDTKAYEAKKQEYDQTVQNAAARESQMSQWQSELDYLVGKGELPPMPAELHVSKANWNDPTVAKQPAVKAQMELLEYFRVENAARTKAKLAPMTSLLDAYQGFARQAEKAQTQSDRELNAQARKNAGAKVAPSAPRPATTAPKGISIGRTGLLG